MTLFPIQGHSWPKSQMAYHGLTTEPMALLWVQGHGIIKCQQLDFSKRQMTLYRKQGHDLVTDFKGKDER